MAHGLRELSRAHVPIYEGVVAERLMAHGLQKVAFDATVAAACFMYIWAGSSLVVAERLMAHGLGKLSVSDTETCPPVLAQKKIDLRRAKNPFPLHSICTQ